MKFIISLLLTALFAFALGLFIDWWSIAIASFIVAVCIPQQSWKTFLSGAIGIAILWGGYSLFLDRQNNGLLARKIASVLPLGGSTFLLIFITAFIGGLVGGLAALSGSFLRKAPVREIHKTRNSKVVISEKEPAI